ncbi:superoxide dismutase [Paraburkholderia kururiensis]|uniref:superoxide dismutase n=1 Tax=Paraburkholderia kururiensis TaxID=984307 RepID=UPI000E0BE80F|nr:superoxide dismutase [Paraburkholderia kururiensis]
MNEQTLAARRAFLTKTAASGAGLALAGIGGAAGLVGTVNTAAAQTPGGAAPAGSRTAVSGASPQTLPPLPYAENALEPVISAQTVSFHYGKHHRGYFDNLAKLTPNTPFAGQSLEALIVATYGVPEHEAVFNNAAQAWNHNFYWQSLSPSPTRPSEALNAAIVRDFGSVDQLTSKLAAVSASQFGSGWGWLVAQHGKLAVIKTGNADTPLAHGLVPLLTVDVWEHAYYLQYQNRRPEYLEHVTAKLINWDFASTNFARMSA